MFHHFHHPTSWPPCKFDALRLVHAKALLLMSWNGRKSRHRDIQKPSRQAREHLRLQRVIQRQAAIHSRHSLCTAPACWHRSDNRWIHPSNQAVQPLSQNGGSCTPQAAMPPPVNAVGAASRGIAGWHLKRATCKTNVDLSQRLTFH